MVVKRFILLMLLVIATSGCSIFKQQRIIKIALLAPFESRYREVGYEALNAARLAIADMGYDNIDLLAIDDGGSVETAIARANAIQQDPTIKITLVLGLQAADSQVQAAFGNHPIIIVGHWNTQPTGENVFMLASAEIDSRLSENQPDSVTSEFETPFIGSELFALKQVPMLHDVSEVTVMSSASLPTEDFFDHYVENTAMALLPSLIATLTYDATGLAIHSVISRIPLHEITYQGINGSITFDSAGYWLDAPLHEYHYQDGRLVLHN